MVDSKPNASEVFKIFGGSPGVCFPHLYYFFNMFHTICEHFPKQFRSVYSSILMIFQYVSSEFATLSEVGEPATPLTDF